MTDHDDLLTEIGADLDVETSREFAVGVHARVGESRRRTSRVRWALAAAASVGLAWIFVGRPLIGPAVNTTAAVEQPSPAPVVSAEPPVAAPHPTNLRKPSAKVAQVAQVVKTRAALAPSEPHLEVITNQGEVLRALWAGYAVKPGTLVVIDTESVESSSAKPILVEPIVVPSIVVKEIGKEPGRQGSPGSNDAPRIIRRNNATNASKETK